MLGSIKSADEQPLKADIDVTHDAVAEAQA